MLIRSKKWLESLSKNGFSVLLRDDLMSLVITLNHLLNQCGVLQTAAASKIATLIGKGKRTVREWRSTFFKNAGSFPDSEKGHYQRKGILCQHEEPCEAARDYIRSNAVVKGRPNLNAISFCRWVNKSLLPNSILDPGYPR